MNQGIDQIQNIFFQNRHLKKRNENYKWPTPINKSKSQKRKFKDDLFSVIGKYY